MSGLGFVVDGSGSGSSKMGPEGGGGGGDKRALVRAVRVRVTNPPLGHSLRAGLQLGLGSRSGLGSGLVG